jgi:hypothetical protein
MSAVALMFAHSWPTTAARITRAMNYAGIACRSCADPVKADDHSAVLMTASSGWGHLKPVPMGPLGGVPAMRLP